MLQLRCPSVSVSRSITQAPTRTILSHHAAQRTEPTESPHDGPARRPGVHTRGLCRPEFGARHRPWCVAAQKPARLCCPLPLDTKPIPSPLARTHPKLTESCFFSCPGILHTIFFLRHFPSIVPQTRDVLGLELAHIPDAEIETLIDQRVAALVRQLESERHQPHNPSSDRGGLGHGLGLAGTGGTPPSSGGGGGRGQITIQFLEKRRRKTWYAMRGDDEICWESWTVKVTVADPRTEGGMSLNPPRNPCLTPFLLPPPNPSPPPR